MIFVNSRQRATKDEAVPQRDKQALKGSRGIRGIYIYVYL